MGEGVFSSGNWGLVVPGSSSGFLTALVILMESCTVEGSLLQLVLLLWPKIDRVRGRPIGSQGVKGQAYRVPGGQRVGLQGPWGSMGRPTCTVYIYLP